MVSTANVTVTVNAFGSAANLGATASDSMNINNGDIKGDSIVSVNSANPSLSLNEIQMSNLLKVYPNPVMNVTTLEINIPVLNTDVIITISDMKGSTVYKKEINSGYG